MVDEGTSATTTMIELSDGIRLVVRWSNDAWHMDLRVRDFYLVQGRRMIGLGWEEMGAATRVALMTSKNYLTNLAARLVSSAKVAADILGESAQGGKTNLSTEGEDADDQQNETS